jgi:hypothetical protein
MSLPGFDLSLRILALNAVHDKSDWEAAYRRICRWYSTTFHTPLHLVPDLDEAYVLQHYYEHAYEQMEDEEWRKEALEAVETPEERDARIQREKLNDAEFLRRVAADRAKRAAKKNRQPGMADSDEIKQEYESAADRLKSALEGLPAAIEMVKKTGDKIKPIPVTRFDSEQPMTPPEDDGFKMGGDVFPADNDAMGLADPPPLPRRRR